MYIADCPLFLFILSRQNNPKRKFTLNILKQENNKECGCPGYRCLCRYILRIRRLRESFNFDNNQVSIIQLRKQYMRKKKILRPLLYRVIILNIYVYSKYKNLFWNFFPPCFFLFFFIKSSIDVYIPIGI